MAKLCSKAINAMKNWVILFVRTRFEKKLVDILRKNLSADEYVPFLPIKEVPRRSKGIIYKDRKLLFPGYVFIQTGIEASLIAGKLKSALRDAVRSRGIYSILHYGDDKNDVVVRNGERLYWERLFDSDFCVTGSMGFIEGDIVRITSGALVGMESRIKKINRHKREAVVELEVMGAVREVRLMLEVVEKLK